MWIVIFAVANRSHYTVYKQVSADLNIDAYYNIASHRISFHKSVRHSLVWGWYIPAYDAGTLRHISSYIDSTRTTGTNGRSQLKKQEDKTLVRIYYTVLMF
jgi:hypothetical protein